MTAVGGPERARSERNWNAVILKGQIYCKSEQHESVGSPLSTHGRPGIFTKNLTKTTKGRSSRDKSCETCFGIWEAYTLADLEDGGSTTVEKSEDLTAIKPRP